MVKDKSGQLTEVDLNDKVKSVILSKIYSILSTYYNKPIWILELKDSEVKIKVLPELLEDKYFIELIKNKEVIGKNFAFTIIRKGKYLLKVKEII